EKKQVVDTTPVVEAAKKDIVAKSKEPEFVIDEKMNYNYKVVQKFGSKSIGSEGEAKGSIIKTLLAKKLIEIVK
ncbi:hypothetical protein IAI39_11410, partial [Streptococcus pseudopneumoniae]|uniref:hypothetical protein n=1 Tax=Streptococcus pseudopneumoniae TaxID=257758 RepID=UPI0018B03FC1